MDFLVRLLPVDSPEGQKEMFSLLGDERPEHLVIDQDSATGRISAIRRRSGIVVGHLPNNHRVVKDMRKDPSLVPEILDYHINSNHSRPVRSFIVMGLRAGWITSRRTPQDGQGKGTT